jgi:hypothetical protein
MSLGVFAHLNMSVYCVSFPDDDRVRHEQGQQADAKGVDDRGRLLGSLYMVGFFDLATVGGLRREFLFLTLQKST